MKKRFLATFLALFLVLGLLPGTARAAEVASGKCGRNLNWVLDSQGTLTISGSGNMTIYFYNDVPWRDFRKQIKIVKIDPNVTSISRTVFDGCTNLTSINLPDGITSIGQDTFNDCKSLTSITIPDSVKKIGHMAFARCYSLASIIIPDGVKTIDDYAFAWCKNLTSVNMSNSVETIGDEAFTGCSSLKSINLSNRLTDIGYQTFSFCTSLSKITIPDSVKTIHIYAFSQCSNLTDITIPDSVTKIGYNAFEECTSLENLTLPSQLNTIDNYLFLNCHSLKTIDIPANVQSIGYFAFSGCNNLTTINIPKNVSSINHTAFSGCPLLTEVSVAADNIAYSSHNGVLFDKDREQLIFYPEGKTDASYTIPDGTIKIGEKSFFNKHISSVTIPTSVTSIATRAFPAPEVFADEDGVIKVDGCENLREVYYAGTKEQWDKIEISEDNDALTSATIHFATPTQTYQLAYTTNSIPLEAEIIGVIPEPTDYVPGETVTVTTADIILEGYEFTGWASSEIGRAHV